MALYIGNRKIASNSGFGGIGPDLIGGGLQVNDDGKLEVDLPSLAQLLSEQLANNSDE